MQFEILNSPAWQVEIPYLPEIPREDKSINFPSWIEEHGEILTSFSMPDAHIDFEFDVYGPNNNDDE